MHAVAEKALSTLKDKPIVIDVQDDFADQSLLKKLEIENMRNF